MRFTRTVLLVALLALIAVPAALAIRFTDDSYNMPTGTVGQPYSKTFGGAGGCGPALPYQYTQIGGSLPPGLSLSKSGTISGTPSAAGSFSFWVNLSDENPPSADWCRPAEAQREFTITVVGGAPAVPLSIVASPLKATMVSTSYSAQLTASGGGTQSWSIVEGALPAGLQLSSSGLISGTPTASGDFTFKVRVTDGTRSATQTFSLTVVQQLKIDALTVPTGEVSLAFRLKPSAKGGKAAYTWSAASLPEGIAIDGATGELTGKPSVAGSFPVKLTVVDSLGFTATADVTLTFAPKLGIATRALKAARVGRAFSVRLATLGGIAPKTWSIVRGALPAGMKFSARAGAFSGTPRRAGTSTFIVQVTDALGAVARVTLRLNVKA